MGLTEEMKKAMKGSGSSGPARLFNADSPPGLSLICNSVRPSEVTDKKADSRIGNV